MAEILIRAKNNAHPDSTKDRRGSYKKGYPVVIMDDGHEWGNEETLPGFVILKIPKIPKAKVQKYIEPELDGNEDIYRRREWQIRWADLPQGAKDRLANDGELVIKATAAYTGTYDYTWTQVKSFFRNLRTNQDETTELE